MMTSNNNHQNDDDDIESESEDEFIIFLRESIYGKTPCSWNYFAKTMERHGFEIAEKQRGAAHYVLKTGTNKKFTIHKPSNEREPLKFKYLSFIQSGLSHVFGLTKESVN